MKWEGDIDIEALQRHYAKQKPKRKLLLPIMLITILSLSVFAVWSVFLQSGFTATIQNIADFGGGGSSGSQGDVTFTIDFGDITLNLDEGELWGLSVATINNPYQNIKVQMNSNIERIDVLDDCIDFQNDCSIEFYYESVTVADEDNFTILQGSSELTANISCIEDACPQQINVGVTLDG